MEQKKLTNILFRDLDKPENERFVSIILKFMEQQDPPIKTATSALIKMADRYEFVSYELEAWQDKHRDLSNSTRQTILELRVEIAKQKAQIEDHNNFFTHLNKLSHDVKRDSD